MVYIPGVHTSMTELLTL